jgi:hypothetical protein
MKTVTIEVTASDIFQGRPSEAFECPVAIAAARALGKTAGLTTTSMLVGGDQFITVPPQVTEWITRFDTGQPVEPITFTVNVPDTL